MPLPSGSLLDRIVALALLAAFAAEPLALAQPDRKAMEEIARNAEAFKKIDTKRTQAVSARKLGSYAASGTPTAEELEKLKADVRLLRESAQSVGAFSTKPEFAKAWEAAEAKILSPQTLPLLKNATVDQITLAVFASAEAELANAADAKDPETEERKAAGALTAGDKQFVDSLENAGGNPYMRWIFQGVVMGGTLWILDKVRHAFFFGPVIQITNTVFEPAIRPVRERLEQIVNRRVAPKFVGWANFVTGEWWRRRKAVNAAKKGEDLKGDAARYLHPAVTPEDFVKDTETFYSEFMKADAYWKGWQPGEYIRARNTGFSLLYDQWAYLNERLNSFQLSYAQAKDVEKNLIIPALEAEGAKRDEIAELTRLIRRQKDLMVFEGVRNEEARALAAPIQAMVQRWLDRGMSPEAIRKYYLQQLDIIASENRPAFALTHWLRAEMYYQENNLALKDLPNIQKWQEEAREISNFYEELTKHQDRIEKFFKKQGITYDVSARIAQRGFPLGGRMKPANVPAVGDCVLEYLSSAAGRAQAAAPAAAKAADGVVDAIVGP